MLLFIILLGVFLQSGAQDQCDTNLLLKFRVSTHLNSTKHRIIEEDNDESLLPVPSLCHQKGDPDFQLFSEVISFESGKYATFLNSELLDTGCGVIIIRTRSQSGNGTSKGPKAGGFKHFQGVGYYKVLNEEMTWTEGRDACKNEEATMWMVNSKKEYETVYNWTGDGAWIGVHRNSSSEPWSNVLDQPMGASDFFEWLYGRPTAEEDNNCLLLDSSFFDKVGMNNDKCETKRMVVCERPE